MVSFYVSKKNGGRGKSKKNGEKKVTLELFVNGGEKKMGVGIFVDVTGGIMVSLISLGVGLFCASDVCFHFSGCTV